MEKIDEVILHAKFMSLAEKCTTIEKMNDLCAKFMIKYGKPNEKPNDAYMSREDFGNRMYQRVPSEKGYDFIHLRAYRTEPDRGFGLLKPSEEAEMLQAIHRTLMDNLIYEAVKSKGIEFTSTKEVMTMETKHMAKMTIAKERK